MSSKVHTPKSFPRWQGAQRRIAITGGVACGKSSVGKYLQEIKALPTLDADIYAREALNPGENVTQKIINRYGKKILDSTKSTEKSINRSALRKIIFNNADEKLWLESLIHPIVIKRLKEDLECEKDAPTIVLIIPLLFEARMTNLCTEIWVVSCNPEQQLERLLKRDHMTTDIAMAMVQSQWPIEQKRTLADVIINNSNEPEKWATQIESFL